MSFIYILLCIIGGGFLGFQASINGDLGNKIGSLQTAALAYSVGAIFLLTLVILFGKLDLSSFASVSLWKLFIGICGGIYILCVTLSVPIIGVFPALLAGIAGQLLLGVVIDHFGLFGAPKNPISWNEIIAISMLFGSLFLLNRN